MFCRNCGKDISDATNFCYHCGSKLEDAAAPQLADTAAPVEETVITPVTSELPTEDSTSSAHTESPAAEAAEPASPTEMTAPEESTPAPVEVPAHVMVPTPADLAPAAPEEAPAAPKKKKEKKEKVKKEKKSGGKGGFIAAIIVLVLLVAGSAVLNYLQYQKSTEDADTIKAHETTIADLQETVTEKETAVAELEAAIDSSEETIDALNNTIAEKDATISEQNTQIFDYKQSANLYGDICRLAKGKNFGYGSEYFFTNTGIIVLSKSETNKKLTLTTDFPSSVTISVEYTDLSSSLEFDQSSWNDTVTLTVHPSYKGVNVATFTNTYDSSTVKVLIIVTD